MPLGAIERGTIRAGDRCRDVPLMLAPLARLGYASKAAIYAIIGVLAVLTALNRGGRITDTSGALRVVLRQPYGRTLLIVLAVGLLGYAAWRLLDAILDPDRHGTSAHGLMVRLGNVLRGAIYGGLGLEAIQLLRGLRGSRGNEARLWTARFLALPFGELLVFLTGAAIVAYGLWQLYQGVTGRHDAKVDWSCIPSRFRHGVQRICQLGVAVRGGLLVTLGVYLARAAMRHDPSEVAGSRESILRLGGVVEGRWVLAVIAAGLIAYAVDQAVHARCRRIRPVV
jgi:hypothetical protein